MVFPEGADLFDPSIVLEAMERSNGTEGLGIYAGPSTGSEGDDCCQPFPDNTTPSGLGEDQGSRGEGMETNADKGSNEEDNVDWEEGVVEEPEEPSEDVALLPYQSAAEFDIRIEANAQFIGLQRLADAELFVSALQFNLKRTNQKVVAGVLGMCMLEYGKT